MSGARIVFLAALLAIGVAVLYQGLVRILYASFARDQPASILVQMMSSFLGLVRG